jgi:catecholate siderophore receptor
MISEKKSSLFWQIKVKEKLSLRLNTMYEKTGTFRQFGDIERFGFNPNATIHLGKATDVNVGYEYFRDKRLNDRGIPSQNGVAYVTVSICPSVLLEKIEA